MDNQSTLRLDESPDEFVTQKIKLSEICGIDVSIVEKFLVLFRDHYKKCEKATVFLETRTGISNVAGIANQRDAISHFATALQPDTPDDKRNEQYTSAEEHFRRAIIEPYEIALGKKTDQLREVYEKYTEFVIPIREKYEEFSESPNDIAIETTIKQIASLRNEARQAKGRNMWDEVWESGIEGYIEAFHLADELYRNLKSYINIYNQIKRDEERDGEIQKLKADLKKRDEEIKQLKNSK